MRRRKKGSLSEDEAVMAMRRGAVLKLLHAYGRGYEYYVVPHTGVNGGHVHRKDAEKILKRVDVHAHDDGLFPDSPQSWKLGA
jgi:hypothetical protein